MSRIPLMRAFAVAVALFCVASTGAYAQNSYFPPPDPDWERRSAAEVGMDSALVAEAVAYAIDSETSASRDLLESTQRSSEPHNETIGPIQPRGDMTGLIIRHGYIVAEWGEPFRVDMTFSVSKSFLSTTVGLAWDAGLIRDLDDPVWEYGLAEYFESPHNQKITWDHLLRQTSDWEGTLWDKPAWADRPVGDESTWQTRTRNEPGTAWKYNDVRVNLLALAALNVWGESLPDVLAERVMNPIGASDTWRWHGYENSWVDIGGQRIQSVSGGGHWGGGMFISARDQARFGLFTLHRGMWDENRLLSNDWFDLATTPTVPRPGYGFMNFFLNTDQRRLPDAPESVFVHLGSGTNMIYVDAEHDLVIVVRWIRGDRMSGLVSRVLHAIE
ncbi:MAG: serine hydrolase [Gemmatimonadota bacterium]